MARPPEPKKSRSEQANARSARWTSGAGEPFGGCSRDTLGFENPCLIRLEVCYRADRGIARGILPIAASARTAPARGLSNDRLYRTQADGVLEAFRAGQAAPAPRLAVAVRGGGHFPFCPVRKTWPVAGAEYRRRGVLPAGVSCRYGSCDCDIERGADRQQIHPFSERLRASGDSGPVPLPCVERAIGTPFRRWQSRCFGCFGGKHAGACVAGRRPDLRNWRSFVQVPYDHRVLRRALSKAHIACHLRVGSDGPAIHKSFER